MEVIVVAVPKHKQTESKKGFYHDTKEVCLKIVRFLIKDFGVKTCMRDLKTFTYKAGFTKEEKEQFENLCSTHNISVEASYPEYIFDHYRLVILNLVDNIIIGLASAYSINPNSIAEIQIKNKLQHELIENIESLIAMLDFVIRIFTFKKVDIEKYNYYIEELKNASKKVKTWKKNSLKSTKDIEARELMMDLANLERGYSFVSAIVEEEFKAAGIDISNININPQDIVNKCLENKKKSKKNKKLDQEKLIDFKLIIDTSENEDNLITPDFTKLIESKHNLVKMKGHEIYFDYDDMLDLGNGIKIPNCIYNENFETKILIKCRK